MSCEYPRPLPWRRAGFLAPRFPALNFPHFMSSLQLVRLSSPFPFSLTPQGPKLPSHSSWHPFSSAQREAVGGRAQITQEVGDPDSQAPLPTSCLESPYLHLASESPPPSCAQREPDGATGDQGQQRVGHLWERLEVEQGDGALTPVLGGREFLP